jgi:dienelactone hydrolase
MASHESQVVAAGVPARLRYALHVPFYPSCSVQYYKPRSTGAPIFMLLGGADSYVGHEPCETYAAAMRAEGARIEVKVFPGASHGFDGGASYFNPQGENYSQCVTQQQADGSWKERKSGITTIGTDGKPIPAAVSKALAACRTLGVSGGGNDAAAKQSMVDLKSYVRRYLLGG